MDRLNNYEQVCSVDYWRQRYQESGGEINRAIFVGSIDQLAEIEQQQARGLLNQIGKGESVLDCGCGYGRLLTMIPDWGGRYLGIDLVPEFILEARKRHPSKQFMVADLRTSPLPWPVLKQEKWDVGVVLWLEEMITRNLGKEQWNQIESNLLTACKRLLKVW